MLEWYESTPDTRQHDSQECIVAQYTRHLRTLQLKKLDVRDLDELLHLQESVNDRVSELLEIVHELNNPGHWYTCAYS